jgi:hypothetical protein
MIPKTAFLASEKQTQRVHNNDQLMTATYEVFTKRNTYVYTLGGETRRFLSGKPGDTYCDM